MKRINNLAPSDNVLNPNGLSNKPLLGGAKLFNTMEIAIKSAIGEFIFFIDSEDYSLIKDYKWFYSSGYVMTRINGVRTYLHRYLLNAGSCTIVDHINGNTLDNRKCNLRLVTKSLNALNSKKRSNTSSKYKGVTWNRTNKNWTAQASFMRKHYYIGSYNSEIDAAKAYNFFMFSRANGYAKLNKIDE